MIQIPSDILTLTSEPAVLFRHGRLIFANKSAEDILGQDCKGKSVKALFGQDIAGMQAPSFVADAPVMGKHYILRVSRSDDVQAIFFSLDNGEPVLLNDAFLCSMRNGLMNISAAADLGRLRAEELTDPKLLSDFSSLTKNLFVVLRLLSNVSAVRGIMAGELPVTLSRFDLAELLQKLLGTVSILRPDIDFGLNIEGDCVISADPTLLELLVLNLLSNCLIHASGLSRISLGLMASGEQVILSVSDNGCGIRADELHAVFSRYRHGFDIGGLGSGTGLGLTVVRGIAEYHGGTVLMESRENSGTTVRASISKKLGNTTLREPGTPYSGGIKSILIGLADCLPPVCFSENYMD